MANDGPGRQLRLTVIALCLAWGAPGISSGGGPDTVKEKSETAAETASIALEDEVGTVSYWSDTDRYVINFAIEGTIDSMATGIVDDLDERYRKPGLRVRVTGRLTKTPDLPPPMLGGQQIFRLEISRLSPAD